MLITEYNQYKAIKLADRSFTLATQHLIHSRLLSLFRTMNDNESSVSLHPPSLPWIIQILRFISYFFKTVEKLTSIASGATVATDLVTGPGNANIIGQVQAEFSRTWSIQRSRLHLQEPTRTWILLQSEAMSCWLATWTNFIYLVQVLKSNEVYEFETESSKTASVKGNLKKHLGFWDSIGTPPFIRDTIENGYKLPFTNPPEPAAFKNNRSSKLHAQFVENAISELNQSGRIIECHEPPLVIISPLSVSVQPGGKKRLILDLRYVNKSLVKKHVKYEDWKVAMPYFDIGSFMFTFDLKSGYHHIEIFDQHQSNHLGFAWTYNSSKETKFYKFTVLPFGLSTAPHIFTKVLKPLEKHRRRQNICIAIFLNDGCGISKDIIESKSASNIIKNDLANAGFVSNEEKSVWEPCQTITWLGIVWNSGNGTIAISERRLETISATIDSIIDLEFVVSASANWPRPM